MSRLRLIFSEAWSSITANISTSFAATMTVLIGMFLLGLFIALGTWVLSYSNHVKRELVVNVYFATGPQQPTQAQEYQVGQRLRHDPRVKTATFVSKAAALKTSRRSIPLLYANAAVEPAAGLVGRDARRIRTTRRRSAARSRRRRTTRARRLSGPA